MTVKNLPNIIGIDKIRVYQDNKILAEQWIGGAGLSWYFEEIAALKPFAEQMVDYLEVCIEGCLSEVLVGEIYLK